MRVLSLLILATVVAVPAGAQSTDTSSLGAQAEKAKRQRAEQRAKATGPVKTFTNDNITSGSATSATTADGTGTAAADATKADATKPEKQEKTSEEIRAEKRADILKKIDVERQRMADVDKVMAAAQTEAGDLTNYTYGSRRAALQKVLEDGQAQKAKSQQTIADLEEEARRIGVSASQ